MEHDSHIPHDRGEPGELQRRADIAYGAMNTALWFGVGLALVSTAMLIITNWF